jgi:hypothetical protein
VLRDPIKILEALEKGLEKRVAAILWQNVTRLRDHLKGGLLAGSALQRRGRGIPVVRKRPELVGTILTAGILTPVPWAGVHFGPRGTAVTISPKRGQFLALPTEFVRRVRGHPVGPKQYGSTVIFKGIIWGRAGWGGSEGLRQRRAAGERYGKQALVPLFILKGSVVVKRRIDPQMDLIDWVKPHFLEDMKKGALIPR